MLPFLQKSDVFLFFLFFVPTDSDNYLDLTPVYQLISSLLA